MQYFAVYPLHASLFTFFLGRDLPDRVGRGSRELRRWPGCGAEVGPGGGRPGQRGEGGDVAETVEEGQ